MWVIPIPIILEIITKPYEEHENISTYSKNCLDYVTTQSPETLSHVFERERINAILVSSKLILGVNHLKGLKGLRVSPRVPKSQFET